MEESGGDAETVVQAIEDIGIDRLTDSIVAAWERAGDDDRGPTWPTSETRCRLDLTDPAEQAGLDTLAAALDLTPRSPETAFVHLGLGRRDDPGGERFAVETIARHADVTATGHHTTGTVPLTGETFDALSRLHGDALVYAVVADDAGRAIVERDWTTLRFSLPASMVEKFDRIVDSAVGDRVERI